MPDPLYRNTSRNYPNYNMNIPDQFRATQFINEMDELYVKPGKPLPRLLYIHLPGDRDGTEFLARICPDSDRSGAAMRASPLGTYRSIEDIVRRCAVQAAVTHNTQEGINSAIAAALMTHHFIYHLGPKSGLGVFLAAHVPGPWSNSWQGIVGTKGTMCVLAAVTAVTTSGSMSGLLRTCVEFTGDVDTVAAIALAAGSCSDEIEQDLPNHLIEHLENGAFGREFLVELDKRLMKRVA